VEPAGILNPGAIDDVRVGDDGVVEVVAVQTAPWDGSDHLLLLTQEKLFNYLTYVADGDLARAHPRARRWRIVVELRGEPDPRTAKLLERAAGQFRMLGGDLVTRVVAVEDDHNDGSAS